MKPILLATVLTLGFLSPQHVQAHPLYQTTEPGLSIQILDIKDPMPQLQTVTAQPLALEGFHFDPIGTHANDYPPGQCTYGVASMKGNVPNWGNANNWAAAAQAAGYTVSSTPIVGAVAQTSRGADGHVAVVTAVYPDHITITEMNWDYNGSVRSRDAAYAEFSYIYM